MKKNNILSISITTDDKEVIIKTLKDLIQNGNRGKVLACANPHVIIEALKDNDFFNALCSFDIVLPDGIGIVFASKMLKKGINKRVSGPDIFVELTEHLNTQNKRYRYFFLGSTEEVLAKIKENMKQLFPNIEVVGVYSPPFGDFSTDENESIIGVINNATPDVLWVGMTAPKQEKWIYENKDKLNVPLIGAIGAAFDFFAGTKKRAPKWAQKLGLEWLIRFLREPKRLWRRNLVSSPLFLFLVLKERLGISGYKKCVKAVKH